MTVRTNLLSATDYYGAGAGLDQYGSDSAGKVIPALFSKKVLRNFYKNTFYNDICNTDYEGEIKGQGDTVNIRATPTLSVGDYNINTDIDYEVPVSTALQLTIDQAKYLAFKIDDIDKAQTDLALVNIWAQDAAHQLRIEVDSNVLALFEGGAAGFQTGDVAGSSGNKGATAGAISGSIDLGATGSQISITSTNAVDKIVELGQVLDEQDIPSEGRWLIAPAWFCALLKLGDLKRADLTGDATGVIRTGLIGQVDRFMIYQSNNLPTSLDTVTSYHIFAGTKEAMTFASQITKTETLRIQDNFGEYWRTLMVFGRKIVQPTALAELYCVKG